MDEYRTAFDKLNIPQEVFDQIITDDSARGEIHEFLVFCLTSVPSLSSIASVLLQYIAASLSHDDGGPGSGNHGHAGVPGQRGGSAPSDSNTTSSEASGAKESAFTPKIKDYAFEYEDEYTNGPIKISELDPSEQYEYWRQLNMEKLRGLFREERQKEKKTGVKRPDFQSTVYREWYGSKTENVTPDSVQEMSLDKAKDVLWDAIPDNVASGWLREANSAYKPRLVDCVIATPESRAAALNMMYENYKYFNGGDKSFDEFLKTPVKMYRGGQGQKHVTEDVFSAYTLDRKVAEKFAGKGGTVYEAEIRPIDTWGSLRDNGEAEIMVPSWIAPNGNKDNADGGPGSGNFGHEGVEGQRGGSAKSGSDQGGEKHLPISERSSPSVKSGKAFDKYVSDNGLKPLYRGFSAESQESLDTITASMMEGTAKTSGDASSALGKALYFADNEAEARGYMTRRQQENGHSFGKVSTAALDVDAKVGDYQEYEQKKFAEYASIMESVWDAPSDQQRFIANRAQAIYAMSVPEYAASQGCDALHDRGTGYTTVVNQNALVYRGDGGPGSGNHGHAGVPGQVGGSAPGNGSRTVVHGSDISRSYSGKPDIKSVMEAQGFTGLPKVVSKEEFDKAVKASSFIAQRTYSASSQEILDAYRNQLYNGDWYVECETGGAQYGQGMYCAADYKGELTSGIKEEMEHYQELGQERFAAEMRNTQVGELTLKDFKDNWYTRKEEISEEELRVFKAIKSDPNMTGYKLPPEDQKIWRSMLDKGNWNSMCAALDDIEETQGVPEVPSFVETMTLDPSAKIISYSKLQDLKNNAASAYKSQAIEQETKGKGEEVKAFYRIQDGKAADGDWSKVMSWASKDPEGLHAAEKKWGEISTQAQEALTRAVSMDDGVYAAMLGYDAINAEGHGASASYTVILNRTKTIILDGNGHQDAKDDSVIFFQLGSDGVIYAIRAGKVIGWVSAGMSEDKNSDSSEKPLDFQPQSVTIKSKDNQTDGNQNSGNHGHKGVPGQVGGSAPSSGGEELTRFSTSGDRMKISSDLAVKASKSGKTMFTIKAGREIERIYSFAGKGSNQNLVVSGLLAKRLGGEPKEWSHKAGFALTTDTSGKEIEREIHWFEHDEIGQTGFKVKFRNPGGGSK